MGVTDETKGEALVLSQRGRRRSRTDCATSFAKPACPTCGFQESLPRRIDPGPGLRQTRSRKMQGARGNNDAAGTMTNLFHSIGQPRGAIINESACSVASRAFACSDLKTRTGGGFCSRLESYQPFRSAHHFVGRSAQDRLDGDGGVFSVAGPRSLSASGRCFSGGSRSRRSQDDSHGDRTAARTAASSEFFRKAVFATALDPARRRTTSAGRIDARAHRRVPILPCVIVGSDRSLRQEKLVAACAARRSGSPSAIRSTHSPIWKKPPRASASSANWPPHSKVSTRNCAKVSAHGRTISRTRRGSGWTARRRGCRGSGAAAALAFSTLRARSPRRTSIRLCCSLDESAASRAIACMRRSREEMERYVVRVREAHGAGILRRTATTRSCEHNRVQTARLSRGAARSKRNFRSNKPRARISFHAHDGWSAPTVFMLHALMSAAHIGYRRWAAHFNELGWNACFVHLPYHYSRVPRGYWNGELAITADLVRNAEGLRQGVIEVRQLMAALREHGCREFGILGTSYGGWIGALLADGRTRFSFRRFNGADRECRACDLAQSWSRFHATRTATGENRAVFGGAPFSSQLARCTTNRWAAPDRVLFVAGDFDSIARPDDIEAIHQKWRGSELLRVPQGHFGYRMMRDTIAHLKKRH